MDDLYADSHAFDVRPNGTARKAKVASDACRWLSGPSVAILTGADGVCYSDAMVLRQSLLR